LTQNFRSHGRILDLANSVVSLLELLFPQTIDKLGKESSPLDGPKPIVIESGKEKDLESFLFSRASYNETSSLIGDKGVAGPQFGCN